MSPANALLSDLMYHLLTLPMHSSTALAAIDSVNNVTRSSPQKVPIQPRDPPVMDDEISSLCCNVSDSTMSLEDAKTFIAKESSTHSASDPRLHGFCSDPANDTDKIL